MFKQPSKITFELPDWVEPFAQGYIPTTDLGKQTEFVIAASRKNIEKKTGGPFAAAIFETGSGDLVSLGVNLVIREGMSMLHAEMVAFAIAQRKLGTYDLGETSLAHHELVTSTEPCAMCLGAIPWSGIRRLVTSAKDEDARKIGFDEGPKPENWVGALNNTGVQVVLDINRELARDVLLIYRNDSGHIYNSFK